VWARPSTVDDLALNWSRNKVVSLPAIIKSVATPLRLRRGNRRRHCVVLNEIRLDVIY
jgi:hypothetical protein